LHVTAAALLQRKLATKRRLRSLVASTFLAFATLASTTSLLLARGGSGTGRLGD
jgi:hypothetical protein